MTLQSRSRPKSHATSGTNLPGRLRLDRAGRQSGTEVQGPSSPDVRSPPTPTSALTQPRQPSLGHSRRVSPGAFSLARRATRGPLSPFKSFDGATFSARRPLGPPNSSGFIFPHTALQWTVCSPTPLPVTGIQTRQCWEAGRWSDTVRPRGGTLVKGTGVLTQGPSLCHVGTWRAADCVRADGCPQARARWRPDGGPSASGSARNPFPLLVHSGVPLMLFCNV